MSATVGLWVLMAAACAGVSVETGAPAIGPHSGVPPAPAYAEGFRVSQEDGYTSVEVDVSVGISETTTVRYALVPRGGTPPDVVDAFVVEVPVRSVGTLTTTNLAHFDILGQVDKIVAVGSGALVTTPSVVEHVAVAAVPDVADSAGRPDMEKLLAVAPDVVFMDAFWLELPEEAHHLASFGVVPVVLSGFQESHPLGRAEWLVFTALFLGEEREAHAAFLEIERNYLAVVEQAREATARRSIFANTPYEGTWFVPGGASFFTTAVADAGGRHVFDDDDSAGSVAMDIETVLDRASNADVWVQAGSTNGSLNDLLRMDPRLGEFAAFRTGEVWAADKGVSPAGGHPLFELGHLRADLYLADLAKILHPELFHEHDFVFYGRVRR